MNMGPQFQIRKATVADARGIAEVHVRTWQIAYVDYFSSEELQRQNRFLEGEALRRREEGLANPAWTTFVAEQDGRVVGFAVVFANRDELGPHIGELGAIYVDPDCWEIGVGTALLKAGETQLTDAGYESAILWTIAANNRTRRFYERRGWSFDGTTEPHRGALLVRYSKQLRA
jgi:GNAT superfamily N-acetyltransferase